MTPAGLEPAIPGSVGRCLIHWATGPLLGSVYYGILAILHKTDDVAGASDARAGSPAPRSPWGTPRKCSLGLKPEITMTVWPSGLRRWLKAPFRKGVGSNPTAVTSKIHPPEEHTLWLRCQFDLLGGRLRNRPESATAISAARPLATKWNRLLRLHTGPKA